jgi:hypothetical protein
MIRFRYITVNTPHRVISNTRDNNNNNKAQNLFSWDIISININHSTTATLCTLEKWFVSDI